MSGGWLFSFNHRQQANERARKRRLHSFPAGSGSDSLHFMIYPSDLEFTSFTLPAEDIVFRCATKWGVSTITRQAAGQSTDLATIEWDYTGKKIRATIQFQGHGKRSLGDFLEPVDDHGIEHQFRAGNRILHCAYTSDRFVLTSPDDVLLGYDTRVPSGFSRHPVPETFDASVDLLDAMGTVFAAYICMERFRLDGRTSITAKPYSQAWQMTGPGGLSLQAPENAM
ncbi:hypothetical protein DACRYDRAFT_19510, partial [Dacryopinax primogenitus]